MSDRCPACAADEAQLVYSLRDIPVQSAILLDSAEAASAYPTGDLDLSWCAACGFAFNRSFDAGKVRYGDGYEESQGASPTFQRYARELSERWIRQYDLARKRALEIGCGKGEFLELYCTLSRGTGVGFDPAWDPKRSTATEHSAVSFYREQFDERHVPFDADIVICRHTLEHVADVQRFVRVLRAACGHRLSTLVGIEVPDMKRILDESAFWDVYYEHASYFTAGALARLFRQEGFDVLDLRRVYGDQYLVLEARPSGETPSKLPAIADDLVESEAAIARFRASIPGAIAEWRHCFESWAEAGESVALWGSGSKAVGFLTGIGVGKNVVAVVDINPVRNGKYMPGVPVPIVAPQRLAEIEPDHIVIMNPIYRDEIQEQLRTLGIEARLHTTATPPTH